MLMALALVLAATQSCNDVRTECRTCPVGGDKRLCSNIGFACQPKIRTCRPRSGTTPPTPHKRRTRMAVSEPVADNLLPVRIAAERTVGKVAG